MALTQRSGVLGQVQQQAAQTARTVSSTASAAMDLLNKTRVPATAPRPVYAAPAPVLRVVTQSPTAPQWNVIPNGGGGSAAAAQQVLRAAQARQQSAPSLLDMVARNAVASALAVSTGQAAPRASAPPPRELNRMVPSGAMQGKFSPERESQLFDQQIKITKMQADPRAWLDPVYTSRLDAMGRDLAAMQRPMLPIQSPRVIREQRALELFPQNDPLYIRTLTDSQLDALIRLGENLQPVPVAAGNDSPVAGKPNPGEMTKGPGYPEVDAGQYRYPTHLNVDAQQYRYPFGPPTGWANGYPNRSGTQTVASALNQVIDRTSAGRTDQDGGGIFDTIGTLVSAGQEIGGDLVGAGQSLIGGLSLGDAISALTSAASDTYESFAKSEIGQLVLKGLTALDWPRTKNVEIAGDQAYKAATEGLDESGRIGGSGDVGALLSTSPDVLMWMAVFEVDPNSRRVVIDAYENGYSSQSYLAQLEANGVDPNSVGPQFTGGRAVWEAMMGYATDDKPTLVKYTMRILADLVYDPLSYLPIAGTAGKGVKGFGSALRGIEGAGTGTKIAGAFIENIGRGVEIGAKAPDAPVEGLTSIVRKGAGKTGQLTGMFSPSAATSRDAATAAGHQMDEALTAGRASVPDEPARVAFDAEAQGVAPASGPRLISDVPTAGAVDTPAGGERPGAGSVTPPITPETMIVTGADGQRYPAFEALPDAPSSRPDAPVKAYDYNGQPVVIRSVMTRDGGSVYTAQLGVTGTPFVSAERYTDLMDRLPEELGGRHPAIAEPVAAPRPTATATIETPDISPETRAALTEVNRQIAETQRLMNSGTPEQQRAAILEYGRLKREKVRLIQQANTENAAATTAAPTQAERAAAAATGSAPDTPRTAGARETVRAVETGRTGKTGKRHPMSAGDRSTYGRLNKAVTRQKRMAKEDARGLPKKVNEILREQKPGEHEFSPVYGGHRPLDRIVTKAIDSKDPAQMARAEAFVKAVDESVEKHLRPDAFYRTWKRGGAPVKLQRDSRYDKSFFEAMDALDAYQLSDAQLVADVVGLPAPAPRTTRLYRIESKYSGPDMRSDVIKIEQRIKGYDLARGRWFADEPKELGYYIEDMADADGRVNVRYIDVPTSQIESYRVSNASAEPNPYGGRPIDPRIESARPDKEFFVSREMADRAILMTEQQADTFNDLVRTRDNRAPRKGGKRVETPLVDRDARRKTLANGLAKGVLDDIAELQYQLNHLFPMIAKEYPDELRLDGLLGSVGRIESRDFRAESAEWLIREYLDTPNAEQAETILLRFLTGSTELPVIADGVHVPYAHAIPADYHAESIARLRGMREQWRTIKRNPVLAEELSDSMFREADIAAQFDGGLKGPSKTLAAAARANRPKTIGDQDVLLAIGEIKDPEITRILLKGDGKMTPEIARGLDRAMPAGWTAPGYTGPKTEWNVKEALDWVNEYAAANPGFDLRRAIDDIGQVSAGLQPRLSKSELASARRAAKANGLDPSTVKDGASAMERVTATKAVRGLDWYLKHYRAVRLFNPIVGLPNRLGDIVGNAMALMIGRNPWGAAKLFPMTFTEARAFRKVARDTRQVMERWASETPHMAETGMPYPDNLLRYSKLQDAGLTDMLPPMNKAVAGTPRAVRFAASFWTSPYLKDVMVASEMTGRKLAFDRMYTSIIEREGIPAFKDELRKRYGDGADAVFERIQAEASAKGGRSHSGFFSPGDVLAATNDAQLQRIWQRTLNNASERGVKEADHLFFSGGTTNADEIARRTLTFHYWMVRSSALYGRTLLRNPVLLSGFVKMYQEAQRIGEEQGLPDWLNGMMKFYQIPGNATGYAAMDPIGVLFPTFFMDAYSQEGNKFQAVQNLLVPVWSAALGALGLTQNVPNATGTKGIERFVIDMGNFLKGEGVDLAAIPGFGKYIDNDSLTLTIPSEEFTSYLMQAANNVLQRAGVAFGDFQPFDRQANEEDQLFSIGQQIAIQLYGPDMESWTPEQVAELEAAVHQAQYGDGEETWLSETIRANFGREGGARALAALVIPGGVVTRQSYRDEQMALASDYWDAFFSGKATTKDGESAAAGRQMVTAANPVWTALDQEYHAIGTETQQQQHKLFYSMLLSPDRLNPNQSIILDNGDGTYTFYTMRQLAGMDQDDREKVVYAWLESHPDVQANVEFVKNGRDAFKEAHPDYAQYSTYQSGVYDYPGGIAQFRRDMRDNDAFRAAEEAERARLKAQGKSGSVLEAELDQWATSQEAFHAAVGIPYKRGDSVDKTPGPSSVAAVFSLRPDESKSGGSKKSDESKDEPKDPRIDDYWSPEKGVPRLLQDLAQWEYDNQKMEQRFPDAWNAETGDWEDHADSAKERKELGIYNQTFYTPSVTETMKRYEEWEQMNPGGTPEEFFTEMLATEGFGIKVGVPQKAAPKLPGGTVVTPPARPGVTAAMNLLQGRVVNVPKVGSRPQEDSGAERVIEVAKSYVGQIPYVWGSIPGKGQDPSGGWDCSGMVYWLDQNYGTGQLPMGSHYQYQYAIDSGKLFTDMSELQPGDIVFLDTGWYGGAGGNLNPAGHVGIYAGNGQLIQATNESQGTVIKPLDAYGRILGAMHGAWT